MFVPGPAIHFLGPWFSSGLSNYQWSTECIKHDFMFFPFCKILYKHSTFYDRKNVKFEWLINYRITINSKGCLAQEHLYFRAPEWHSGVFRLTLTPDCYTDLKFLCNLYFCQTLQSVHDGSFWIANVKMLICELKCRHRRCFWLIINKPLNQ